MTGERRPPRDAADGAGGVRSEGGGPQRRGAPARRSTRSRRPQSEPRWTPRPRARRAQWRRPSSAGVRVPSTLTLLPRRLNLIGRLSPPWTHIPSARRARSLRAARGRNVLTFCAAIANPNRLALRRGHTFLWTQRASGCAAALRAFVASNHSKSAVVSCTARDYSERGTSLFLLRSWASAVWHWLSVSHLPLVALTVDGLDRSPSVQSAGASGALPLCSMARLRGTSLP